MDPDYEVDTDVVGYMTFASGVTASFDASFNLDLRTEYEVHGSHGSIIVPRAYRPDANGGEGLVIVKKPGVKRTETVKGDQYCAEVEHFSQAILDGTRELYHDLENTIHNMRVLDACYESIETGGQVRIP
ncbi:hypothetical protein JNUCC1_00816 [Lentibacillus sp. JNUCC-1]|uniref:Gfo/Idh/MocA family oxidoreductase n=1 Tax=Lentibacillus sp. JNUCC-1 TaxID=2654513 RepID=UPI001322887E|nr:hypothetical protein [Lentibacillus sp. JNUCC-1]